MPVLRFFRKKMAVGDGFHVFKSDQSYWISFACLPLCIFESVSFFLSISFFDLFNFKTILADQFLLLLHFGSAKALPLLPTSTSSKLRILKLRKVSSLGFLNFITNVANWLPWWFLNVWKLLSYVLFNESWSWAVTRATEKIPFGFCWNLLMICLFASSY